MHDAWLPNGYIQLERLGDGSFGRVELIQREEDNQLFALKVLEKSAGISSAEVEIESLNVIDSPFVAHLYDVIRQPNSISLMIDPALGGSLRQRIAESKERNSPMSTDTIYSILAQVLLAINDVHQKNIAHRDIGPSNILFLRQKPSEDLRLLLVDFGVSASLNGKKSLSDTVGTPNYMSPEVARADHHDTKTDIYSLGVILYEMCELKLPVKERLPKIDLKFHPEFHSLLSKMLSHDPKNRPTAKELLNLPEISKYASKYRNSPRVKLTSADFTPVVYEFDDIDIDFDALPPIDSTIPTGSGRLLLGARNNSKQSELESKQRIKEQKEDLEQHESEYFQRLEQVKNVKRYIPRGKQNLKGTVMPSIDLGVNVISEEERAADELERNRAILEKQFGAEKILKARAQLEKDMMLSPAELQITPKEFDAISRLIRREKEVYGARD